MRIFDLNKLEDGVSIEADLCIVGSGPAGISIAAEFAKTNVNVLVLESGGVDDEQDTQRLYEIESAGAPRVMDQQDLRRRILGGSSHIWTGRCAPFDALDFESRPWISNSGWPLSRANLDPYLERAAANLGLAPQIYDESLWPLFKAARPLPPLDSRLLDPKFWQFSKSPTYQGRSIHSGVDLIRSTAENVQILLHANLTHINLSLDGLRLDSVDVTTLSGKRARVRSKALVLCCGGIENARLLLASNHQFPEGVGNSNDLVGRFLMDHTDCAIGHFDVFNAAAVRSRFGHYWLDNENGRHTYLHGVGLSRDIQQARQLLNCHVYIEELYPASGAWAVLRRLMSVVRSRNPKGIYSEATLALAGSDEILKGLYRRLIKHRPPLAETERIELHCILEQAPDPQSRITLSEKRDATGLPISKIDWKISDLEQQTVREMARCICQEFKRLGLPSPHIEPWLDEDDGTWNAHCVEKAHPSGTTRMSRNPRDGVVDINCQVHNIQGLFVSGSSVFPTSGAANPTLMIVAMALRLADWLKKDVLANEIVQEAAAPAALSYKYSTRRDRASAPVQVGLIGAGRRMREIYLPVLRELSDRYEVVGFVTRSPTSSQRLESETGIPSFPDAADLVARTRPTLLIAAIQDPHNETIVMDLLEHGVPILAETPLAWSVSGVRRIIEKASVNNTTVGVAEQFPFLPLEQFRGQLIERGVFGNVYATLNDFHSYSYHGIYHGIAQLRRYLRGEPKLVRNVEHAFKPEQGRSAVRWQTGSVVFNSGATLFHNYAFSEVGVSPNVRLYGTSAVMSDYKIELIGDAAMLGSVVAKRELATSGALKSISAEIPGIGLITWENSFAHQPFSDEQIAVATVLDGMAKATLEGCHPIYTCEDFLTDIEIIRAFHFSASRGGVSIALPLNEKQQKLRLLSNAGYWKKKLLRRP
jgi:choline dehydrogenase-like flavoprotein